MSPASLDLLMSAQTKLIKKKWRNDFHLILLEVLISDLTSCRVSDLVLGDSLVVEILISLAFLTDEMMGVTLAG